MHFQGPTAADLAEISALNQAFLRHLGAVRTGCAPLNALPTDVAESLRACTELQRERLARAPFLLFSLREHDSKRWRRVFSGTREPDLIDRLESPPSDEIRIVLAAIGLLWQFGRRNLYTARVVSGAPLAWCEALSEHSLVELFHIVSFERGLLQCRFAAQAVFWRKLIAAACSDDRALRDAARLTALQTVLTAGGKQHDRKLPAAACAMPMPALRVAERPAMSQNAGHGYNTPLDESAADKKSSQNLRKR